MEYKKITAEDIAGKGVVGQADTPLLSALEMQNKVEEVPRAVIIPHFNSLIDSLDKRDADVDTALSDRYTKTETDTAIDNKITELGAGDMAKAIYDTDGDGVVDNAQTAADARKLAGKTPGQLTFGADQIITDETTDERLPETLDKKLNKGVDVTITGEDINNYKTEGVYHFGNSVTPTNIPAGVNGWLVVIGGAGSDRKQLWFRQGTANSNDHEIYVRTLLGDVWSDWTMLITNKGGGFAKPIWVSNANPPTSSWNVKDISVTNSDGSSITGGITKVIAMRRK